MAALDGIDPFSHDDRLWRIRGWLLERTIFLLSVDPRWALIGFGGGVISLLAARARIWFAGVTRRGCC